MKLKKKNQDLKGKVVQKLKKKLVYENNVPKLHRNNIKLF